MTTLEQIKEYEMSKVLGSFVGVPDAIVDQIVRQQEEIESLRQQLSASQKREVTLRKLIGEIYCSDDSSAEVTRKIEDVLNAIGSSYSKESTHSFEDWHNSHAKYMEPADIIHWCRDSYDAGRVSGQDDAESLRQRLDALTARNVMLRDALETCEVGDFSTGHVIYPSFDEKLVTEALASTTNLDDLILCHAVEVGWIGTGPRDGRCEFSESKPANSVMRDFNMKPLYAQKRLTK